MEMVNVPMGGQVFKRLQGYQTEPLLDTVDSVLTRIFDAYDAANPSKAKASVVTQREPFKPTHFQTSRGVDMPIGRKITASYRNKTLSAEVTAQGILYRGKTYEDPSAAAKAAKIDCGASETAASTNGWKFWLMPSDVPGKVTSIDRLRAKK